MAEALSGEKIVHLLATVHHGGAERVVLELARQQRALDGDVRVICLQQLGPLLPSFEAAGIPVELVPGGGRPGALRMAWRLADTLRAARATVVHTHNSAPQITAGLSQRLRHWRDAGTALVHTEHGRLGDVRPALLRWRRWTVTEFDAVCAVSADAQQQLLAHAIRSAQGVEIVLNGIDLARFAPRLGERAPGAHIVHVGRLDRIKGQDVLLAAMAQVSERVPLARLTIVGDGPARGDLEAETMRRGLTDRIRFAGALDDVRPLLESADLFVLPSRSEGISLALLEAMAATLPVVATDVGGNGEVIRSEATGVLVAPERPDLLGEAMIRLLQAPALSRAIGAAARHEVERRFASETTTQVYAAIYERARRSGRAHSIRSAA